MAKKNAGSHNPEIKRVVCTHGGGKKDLGYGLTAGSTLHGHPSIKCNDGKTRNHTV